MSLTTLIKGVAARSGYVISRAGVAHDLAHWAADAEFEAALASCRPYSMLGPDRLFMLWQWAHQARALPGEVAQVGVYRGGSAALIARAIAGSGKSLHLFDTFTGMPDVDAEIDLHKKDDFNDTSLARVQKLFTGDTHTSFYPGVFPSTAEAIKGRRFSFVYIDVDIYTSTRDALAFFYPRLVPGGFLISDDYQGKRTPGVKKAFDEFLADKMERPLLTAVGQCLLIKYV